MSDEKLSDKLSRILIASGLEHVRQEALEELRIIETKLEDTDAWFERCANRALDTTEPGRAYLARHAALEAKLEAMELRFQQAAIRVSKGQPGKRIEFRCSHCGKGNPLLLEAALAAAQEEA